MFEFAWPWLFLILPLPLIINRLLSPAARQMSALKVPRIERFDDTPPVHKSTRFPLLILSFIWILLVIAAARPQWLGEPIAIPSEGRDLMIAVDLSGSMKTQDMTVNGRRVNRLTMIKSVLDDFIQRRVGDRLGLILFADTAYLQAPLTHDRETVATLLSEAQIGLVGEQTAIGDALGLAVKRFNLKNDSNKVLVLLTDGQNTAGNITPEQATELAIHHGITVYTIGVGSGQGDGSSFSMFFSNSRELDEESLTDIATRTGGQYFRAKNTQGLEQIYLQLDELEPVTGDTKELRPLTALFYYPLSAAILLGLLMLLFKLTPRLYPIGRKHA